MKNIRLDTLSADLTFIINSENIPESVEIDEHIMIEDDFFFVRATVQEIYLNGDIEVSMKSRKEHPHRTIAKAIDIVERRPQSHINTSLVNMLNNAFHDWNDGRINTRAIELIGRLTEAIVIRDMNQRENTIL